MSISSTPLFALLRRHKTLLLVLLLALAGAMHRAVLLVALWPAPDTLGWSLGAMQLLPRELLAQNPWAGLLYLQMTPPLPNLIYALLAQIPDPQLYVGALMALQNAISITTSILLALLLVRTGASHLTAAVLGIGFMLWGDLMLIEYVPYSLMFHETLAMLLCCAASHAALSTLRVRSPGAAARLGICIALLALTRASFSYVFIVLPVWFALTGLWRQRRLVLATIIPLLILQGGWAIKNLVVHDYFSTSLSTWGGANLLHGELLRGQHTFYSWLATQQPMCEQPWDQISRQPINPIAFMMDFEHLPQVPEAIAAHDRHIANLRGKYINLDTLAAQRYSQCLQREFVHFWWQNPRHVMQGIFLSYQNFWIPLHRFVGFGLPIMPDRQRVYAGDIPFFAAMVESLRERNSHFLAVKDGAFSWTAVDTNFRPINLYLIPTLGSLASVLSALLFNSLPLLLVISSARGGKFVEGSLLFILLLIVYVIALTSLVEYPENMRFRFAVEPLLWTVGVCSARAWLALIRHAIQSYRADAGQHVTR